MSFVFPAEEDTTQVVTTKESSKFYLFRKDANPRINSDVLKDLLAALISSQHFAQVVCYFVNQSYYHWIVLYSHEIKERYRSCQNVYFHVSKLFPLCEVDVMLVLKHAV